MLKVTQLAKDYPTARGPLRVLSGVSFELAPGDAAAVMGPSGSGKSSLLYILGALEPPSSGTVTINGRDPFSLTGAQLAAFRNQEIGFVFQDHCLLPQLSVLENVLVPTLVADRAKQGSAAEAPSDSYAVLPRYVSTSTLDARSSTGSPAQTTRPRLMITTKSATSRA